MMATISKFKNCLIIPPPAPPAEDSIMPGQIVKKRLEVKYNFISASPDEHR